jgi:hypothetical protein
MMLVRNGTKSFFVNILYNLFLFTYIGINLTADSNQGQLDAYIKNAQWDLKGNLCYFLCASSQFILFRILCSSESYEI